jgi:hypothetical protein
LKVFTRENAFKNILINKDKIIIMVTIIIIIIIILEYEIFMQLSRNMQLKMHFIKYEKKNVIHRIYTL